MAEHVSTILLVFVYLVVSGLAGQWIASRLPWRDDIAQTRLPRALGFVLAPFLVGLISVALLALPFTKSGLFFVAAPLIILAPFAVLALRAGSWRRGATHPPLLGAQLLRVILFLWAAFLLFNAIVYPLTQNDALEYAMVGRLLFETGTLASYPAISPETSIDGFYGPWTHPPLYVSMIALSNFIQGHADTPSLMRMIAPWFLLSATYATYILGNLVNARVGGFAAIILLSTPLMFLGADSALIDALTVASLVMLLCVLSGLDFSRKSAAVSLGVIIGLGMWTHSQALLFLPVGVFLMVILIGVKDVRRWLPAAGIAVLAALAISAAPYLRNLVVMGALISDEPAVFAFAPLDWRGYFDIARGLDHPVAILQYGLFKGWFSLEAYGLSYWFMTIGLVALAFGATRLSAKALWQPEMLRKDPRTALLYVAAGLFLCYFFGTLASILLGMNLMIKNERYLLTTLPAVALIGGYGLERLAVFLTLGTKNKWRPSAGDAVIAFLFTAELFIALHFTVVGFYYRFRLLPPAPVGFENWGSGEVTFLNKSFTSDTPFTAFPSIEAVQYMNTSLPSDALILAARPADMYYAERKMLSYLDLRLLPFYASSDAQEGADILADIGVTHIQMVDYYLPTSYNSVLKDIVADPGMSTLEYDNKGFQVFALKPSRARAQNEISFAPPDTQWATMQRYIIGGRKSLTDVGGDVSLLASGRSEKTFPAFHRDYSTYLMPAKTASGQSAAPLFFDVSDENEYILRLHLEGHGFIRIWAEQYKLVDGRLTAVNDKPENRIYEAVLSDSVPEQTILRRFKPSPDVDKITFKIEHLGKSKVTILDASLSELNTP